MSDIHIGKINQLSDKGGVPIDIAYGSQSHEPVDPNAPATNEDVSLLWKTVNDLKSRLEMAEFSIRPEDRVVGWGSTLMGYQGRKAGPDDPNTYNCTRADGSTFTVVSGKVVADSRQA